MKTSNWLVSRSREKRYFSVSPEMLVANGVDKAVSLPVEGSEFYRSCLDQFSGAGNASNG